MGRRRLGLRPNIQLPAKVELNPEARFTLPI